MTSCMASPTSHSLTSIPDSCKKRRHLHSVCLAQENATLAKTNELQQINKQTNKKTGAQWWGVYASLQSAIRKRWRHALHSGGKKNSL